MNSINDFAALRPSVEPLDNATANELSAQAPGTMPATARSDGHVDDDRHVHVLTALPDVRPFPFAGDSGRWSRQPHWWSSGLERWASSGVVIRLLRHSPPPNSHPMESVSPSTQRPEIEFPSRRCRRSMPTDGR